VHARRASDDAVAEALYISTTASSDGLSMGVLTTHQVAPSVEFLFKFAKKREVFRTPRGVDGVSQPHSPLVNRCLGTGPSYGGRAVLIHTDLTRLDWNLTGKYVLTAASTRINGDHRCVGQTQYSNRVPMPEDSAL
jgi:hypothetical protein